MRFAAAPDRVWDGLIFFEQIERRPPFHLRLLLPRPIRTEGRKSEVGDEVRCLYLSGHILKRVTEVAGSRRYGFDIVEQSLAFGGGIKLSGGSYTLRPLSDGSTEVEVETRYESRRRPYWLWAKLEAIVCHGFHRHILEAMRRHIESREPPP